MIWKPIGKKRRKVDLLEDELARSQFRVTAAEEDAQVALDLAKENAEGRQQLEGWLQKALQEIQMLREHIILIDTKEKCISHISEKSEENSADIHNNSIVDELPDLPQDPNKLTPSYTRPSRAMIAAGQLFGRYAGNQLL
jgi:flagellar motility protein MotE (MotC chaperone)